MGQREARRSDRTQVACQQAAEENIGRPKGPKRIKPRVEALVCERPEPWVELPAELFDAAAAGGDPSGVDVDQVGPPLGKRFTSSGRYSQERRRMIGRCTIDWSDKQNG